MTKPVIRRSALGSADLVEAKGLSGALNWPNRLADWTFAHSLGEGLALRDRDRLIGTGMGWTYGPRFATVGMIIVDAAYQGLRLGSRLVDGLLEWLGERSVILNSTVEGCELYRRRGFTGFGVTCQHPGIAKPLPAPDPEFAVDQASDADWAGMIALDEVTAGMPRRHLLAACGTASELRGKDGEVHGYAICQEFGRGHVIGPVVARGAAKAAALISHAMADLVGRFVRINSPQQAGLGGWLDERGLPRVNTEEAMVRGTLSETASQAHIFAPCSNSLG